MMPVCWHCSGGLARKSVSLYSRLPSFCAPGGKFQNAEKRRLLYGPKTPDSVQKLPLLRGKLRLLTGPLFREADRGLPAFQTAQPETH